MHNLGKPSGMKGKHHSAETRKKMSESNNGENNPRFGKHHSAEARKKISEAMKGDKNPRFGKPAWNKGKQHSAEARKKMSESKKGSYFFNNGVICVRAKTCPEGFVPGRIR